MSEATKPATSRELFESLRKYRRPVPFELPAGKGTIFIQPLGLDARCGFDDLKASIAEAKVPDHTAGFRYAVFLCLHSVVDEQGRKAFGDEEEVVKVLSDMAEEHEAVVFDLARQILDISGMSEKSEARAEKN